MIRILLAWRGSVYRDSACEESAIVPVADSQYFYHGRNSYAFPEPCPSGASRDLSDESQRKKIREEATPELEVRTLPGVPGVPGCNCTPGHLVTVLIPREDRWC